jgi:hypothetical protein
MGTDGGNNMEPGPKTPTKTNATEKESFLEFFDLLVQTPVHDDPTKGFVLLQGQADPLFTRQRFPVLVIKLFPQDGGNIVSHIILCVIGDIGERWGRIEMRAR